MAMTKLSIRASKLLGSAKTPAKLLGKNSCGQKVGTVRLVSAADFRAVMAMK